MGAKNSSYKKSEGKPAQKMYNEINWEDETLNVWRDAAEEKQIFYCLTLGNRTWEKYEPDEEFFLKLKIGFSLFGPQTIKEEDDLSKYFNEPHQKAIINKITDTIKNECNSENICIGFIFIIGWVDEKYAEFPVIRMLKENKGGTEVSYFIDALGRLYKSWPEFLQNNVFPKCIYCYPTNGFYSWTERGEILLEFGQSPNSNLTNKVISKLDTASTVAGIGSAVVGIASLAIPVAGPIIMGTAVTGVTTGIWSTLRTVVSMVDRKKHGQSLSLKDQEGRACWLSLAVGILGAASSGAVQYTQFITRNGRALNKLSSVAIKSLGIGNVSAVGLGILNDIATMIQNKDLSPTDCSELVMTILFFCHCTMSLRTAKDVVLDIQSKILTNIGSQLNAGSPYVFKGILDEAMKFKSEGNSQVVRSLRLIENKESFFRDLLQIHKTV